MIKLSKKKNNEQNNYNNNTVITITYGNFSLINSLAKSKVRKHSNSKRGREREIFSLSISHSIYFSFNHVELLA